MSEFYVAKFGILNMKDLWAGVLFPSAPFPFLFPSSVIFLCLLWSSLMFSIFHCHVLSRIPECLLLLAPPAFLFGDFLFICPHSFPKLGHSPNCECSHSDVCNLKSVQMMLIAKYICRYDNLSC